MKTTMMIIIPTHVINYHDLVIMIVLTTIIIWPFLVDSNHGHDYFPLETSAEMPSQPLPGSTSCHQKNMNFSHSAGKTCEDTLPKFFSSLRWIVLQASSMAFAVKLRGVEIFGDSANICFVFLKCLMMFVCAMSNVLWSLYWDRM